MKRYLATAVVHALAVALGVTMLSFVFMRMSGDPVMLMLPPDATHQQIEDFRERIRQKYPDADDNEFLLGLWVPICTRCRS